MPAYSPTIAEYVRDDGAVSWALMAGTSTRWFRSLREAMSAAQTNYAICVVMNWPAF